MASPHDHDPPADHLAEASPKALSVLPSLLSNNLVDEI
jgi:hypothetical protein